jgi:pimeloyl-ACP methyl ester carboxylesterase
LVKSLVLEEPPIIPFLVTDANNPLHALSLLFKDFSTGKSFLKFGIKAIVPAKKELKKGNTEEGVRLFANGVLGKGGYERLPEEVKAFLLDNSTALKAELLGPGFPQEFPRNKANKLTVPTLLVCGENSPKFFHSISNKLFHILPNCQQLTIADASHDMHEDMPEVYNNKILEFLSNHNSTENKNLSKEG